MGKGEQVVGGFWDLLNKKIWLDRYRMKERLEGFKPSEVHCIEYIGKNEDPNVTKLADSFYMTNGAISKLTKKLMEKGIVESYQKPENKKEIYFRLTEQGNEVYRIHEDLHQEFQDRDQVVLAHFSEEQFEEMLRFVDLYNEHLNAEIAKLNLDMKKQDYDRM